MSLISKLFKLGVVAGTAYAAVKVSEKYNEKNPEGVTDKVEKLNAVKEAATEVFSDVSKVAEEKAPEVMKTVTETAQKAAELAKQYAPGAVSKVQEAAKVVSEKAMEFSESLKNEVYDADFSAAEDEQPCEAPAEDSSAAEEPKNE